MPKASRRRKSTSASKMQKRSKEEFLQELRRALTAVPGMNITIGQPISHRIDHMLSGTRANIAVKIFGDDLRRLRTLAQQVRDIMAKVPGVVDLSIEQQTDIPDPSPSVRSGAHRPGRTQSGRGCRSRRDRLSR